MGYAEWTWNRLSRRAGRAYAVRLGGSGSYLAGRVLDLEGGVAVDVELKGLRRWMAVQTAALIPAALEGLEYALDDALPYLSVEEMTYGEGQRQRMKAAFAEVLSVLEAAEGRKLAWAADVARREAGQKEGL